MYSIDFLKKNIDVVCNNLFLQTGVDYKEKINKIIDIHKEIIVLNKKLENISLLFKKNQELFNKYDSSTAEYIIFKNKIKTISNSKKNIILNIDTLISKRNNLNFILPNVSRETVPVGKSEKDNQIIFEWKNTKNTDKKVYFSYIDISKKFDLVLFKNAAEQYGNGSTIYNNKGAILFNAIIQFCLEININSGYNFVLMPTISSTSDLYGSGQLPKFQDDLFKVDESFLSPTGEVQLVNFFKNKIIDKSCFPIKLTTFSSCFRREIGSAGRDTKGLLRLHEFRKVEVVEFVVPKKSNISLENTVEHVKKLIKMLGLPFRCVKLCTGELGFSAIETIDIEVYFPFEKRYIEVSSISNCSDFQSRRTLTRYRDGKKKIFPHTINGSSLAIDRIFAAILENNYNNNKVNIPKILHKFLSFKNII